MSDSEYSVNDQQNANASAKTCSTGGCGCCKHCPLNSLAPENLEATLTRHSTFIDEFQGAVFYRRPIAFVALIVSVNLIFFIYRKLDLNFYALCSLLGIIYIGLQLIPSAIYSTIKSTLFPGQLNKGRNADPDRVRDTNELVAPINTALAPLFGFIKIVNALSQDQSVTGLLIYGSVFFCLFCITASVDFFWPIVIFTNFALILPGVLTRPQVIPYVQKAKEHLHTQPEEGQAQPAAATHDLSNAANDIASKVSDAANAAADKVSEAAGNAANAAEDAIDDLRGNLQ